MRYFLPPHINQTGLSFFLLSPKIAPTLIVSLISVIIIPPKQLLFIQLPYHSCNLANDVNIGLPLFNNDWFHGWMFGFQLYCMPFFVKPLYGGLVIYEGNHDLSVICYRLWFNEDKVSLLYVCLNHAVSYDPQKKGIVAAAYRSVYGKVSFDIFYGRMRCPCPDLSHNRNRPQFQASARRLKN